MHPSGLLKYMYHTHVIAAANPQCPSGIMQWQHGTYTVNFNNTVTLNPIAVDGRQLQSDPCTYKNSIYTRYNQTENFKVTPLMILLFFSAANFQLIP